MNHLTRFARENCGCPRTGKMRFWVNKKWATWTTTSQIRVPLGSKFEFRFFRTGKPLRGHVTRVYFARGGKFFFRCRVQKKKHVVIDPFCGPTTGFRDEKRDAMLVDWRVFPRNRTKRTKNKVPVKTKKRDRYVAKWNDGSETRGSLVRRKTGLVFIDDKRRAYRLEGNQ